MKIIIVGAGFTGTRLARRLVSEEHSVVLIDKDEEIVRHASNRLDCMVMQASGNSLATLETAGIASADAIVMLTESDELNMITCGLVQSVYPNVTKIARVRNDEYYADLENPNVKIYGIDFMVHPDLEAAREIITAVEHGAITDVIEFDDSDFELAAVYIEEGSCFVGATVQDVRKKTTTPFLFAFIERDNESIFPSGNFILQEEDRIGILVHKKERNQLLAQCGSKVNVLDKIALVGAGKIGTLVADSLFKKSAEQKKGIFGKVKRSGKSFVIIDSDRQKAKAASERFPSANVYNADITDESFLEEEHIKTFDLMIAATRNHELNMIASAYMKNLGVSKSICLVKTGNYEVVARDIGIDITVPIKDAVIDSILGHLRGKSVTGIHTVTDGKLEVVEIVLPKDSPVVGKKLPEISDLSSFIVLLLKAKDKKTFTIPTGETIFAAGDSVVFLMKTDDDFDALNVFGVGL